VTVRPLLDTHAWVWWLLGDGRLKRAEREALDALPAGRRPVLCDISLWEMAMLVELGRVRLENGLEGWLSTATSSATVAVQGITPAIVAEMNRLPSSFHRDPADRLIVATARVLDLPLVTRDRKITGSRLVKIWRP
jgi:PIN domain nuclease of toxin-antitoxin system